MTKKEQPRRRSLNERLDAEMASAENITVAGISEDKGQPKVGGRSESQGDKVQDTQDASAGLPSETAEPAKTEALLTKKATTIMPKEVFNALQRYCLDADVPKHRALYGFILQGLHAAGTITDEDLQRFRDMAAQLTTTYEKK